jgi:predicted RNase H-like nuclease (RuvC/YqgF family)
VLGVASWSSIALLAFALLLIDEGYQPNPLQERQNLSRTRDSLLTQIEEIERKRIELIGQRSKFEGTAPLERRDYENDWFKPAYYSREEAVWKLNKELGELDTEVEKLLEKAEVVNRDIGRIDGKSQKRVSLFRRFLAAVFNEET